MQINKIKFVIKGDERGNLIALEQCTNIPFEMKRVYYMYGMHMGSVRGKHAHKALEQVLICINGSCDVLLDNGHERETVFLNKQDEGIYIGPGIWREMFNFSTDAVVLTIASEVYNESDYIRNYDDFIEWMKK